MPEPGCSARWSASQARLLGLGPQPDHPELERLPVEGAAQHEHVGAQPFDTLAPLAAQDKLLPDVVGDPGVGGRGGRQHRDAVGQVAEQGADPPVVGPEVVAPVGDAVRLVDHQQATGRSQPGQHLVAEAGVVEPLGADQQDVDLACVDRGVDRLPVLDVRRVDGDGADAGPLGGGDLVAHQRQQRGDDHGRPRALGAEQQRGHEVDRRLAPARALDDQRAPTIDGQRLDRRPLVLAQPRVVAADEGTQVCLGPLAGHLALLGGRGHACMSNRSSGRSRTLVHRAPSAHPPVGCRRGVRV